VRPARFATSLAGEQAEDLAPVHQPAEAAVLVHDDEPLTWCCIIRRMA